jgi:quercetin dioxygenase-like cupin family protein
MRMTENEFRQRLAAEGFGTVVLVEREPGSLDTHTHPFEAQALILDGDITIVTARGEQRCVAGDTFHLAANEPHTESYGPRGVTYLAGRKSSDN